MIFNFQAVVSTVKCYARRMVVYLPMIEDTPSLRWFFAVEAKAFCIRFIELTTFQ